MAVRVARACVKKKNATSAVNGPYETKGLVGKSSFC
jgi:hypothetical protein